MAGIATTAKAAKASRGPNEKSRATGGFPVRLSGFFASALDGGITGVARLLDGRGTVDQLDQRHRRVVALAEAELEDAQVAAVARLVARAQLVEELDHHLAIAQAVERQAAVG